MYNMIRFLSAPNMSCDILQQGTNTFCINLCLELFHTYCDLTRNVLRDGACDYAIKRYTWKKNISSTVLAKIVVVKRLLCIYAIIVILNISIFIEN